MHNQLPRDTARVPWLESGDVYWAAVGNRQPPAAERGEVTESDLAPNTEQRGALPYGSQVDVPWARVDPWIHGQQQAASNLVIEADARDDPKQLFARRDQSGF